MYVVGSTGEGDALWRKDWGEARIGAEIEAWEAVLLSKKPLQSGNTRSTKPLPSWSFYPS